MQPMTIKPMVSFEEALAALVQLAKENGDNFRVRVLKRSGPSPTAPLEQIALFSDARLEHLSQPEAWLSQLAGGGVYVLVPFHENEPNTPVSTLAPAPIMGQPRPVDAGASVKAGWTGPGTQLFPPVPVQTPQPVPPFSVRGLYEAGAPGSADVGGGARTSTTPGAPGALDYSYVQSRLDLMDAQRKAETDAITRMIEAQGKNTDRQIAAMMEVVKATANRPPPPPEKSIVDQLAPLAVPLAPVLISFFEGNAKRAAEDRRLAAEEAARRESREAEARKVEREMLLQMNERASSASADMMKVVSPMVDAVSQMGRTVLQQVATMREMTAEPPQEEGIGGLIREGARAFAAEYAAMRREAAASAPPPQPQTAQLPPGAQSQPQAQDDGDLDVTKLDPAQVAQEIESGIRSKIPVSDLADGYMVAITNVGFAQMVQAAGGALSFFGPRLVSWLNEEENANYVRDVVAELTKRGVKV